MLTHQRRQTAADQAKTTKTPRRVLSFPIELDHAIARSPDHAMTVFKGMLGLLEILT
jgi:hypothetical protein